MERGASRLFDTARAVLLRPIVKLLPYAIHPNHLSFLRLILVVPIVAFLMNEQWWAALIVYVVAALTDALDGELARMRNTISAFGARLDPLIDKILHIAVAMVVFGAAPLLFFLNIAADIFLAIIGGVLAFSPRLSGQPLHANAFGKMKFILQSTAIIALLFAQIVSERESVLLFFGRAALAAAFLCALLSIFGYLRTFFSLRAQKRA